MIGEPEWPFGATHCRMELFKDSKRIIKHPIDIYDDGAIAHKDNFDIKWHEDNVTVTVSGSEQDDNRYILSFDGTIEYIILFYAMPYSGIIHAVSDR